MLLNICDSGEESEHGDIVWWVGLGGEGHWWLGEVVENKRIGGRLG